MRLFPFILLMVITGSVCSSCGEEIKKEEKYLRQIKYETVRYLDSKKIRTFSGTAETDKVINLSFRNTGIITQFNINLGQKVRRGQLLGKLDNVQARLSYEQSITQLNSSESQMNTAKLSLDRVRVLFEKGSASLSEFESAKNAYKTAQESFQSAKRGVDIQKEQIKFGYLYAPANGIIAEVIAEKDENINPGQTVATLNAGKNMEIKIGLPETAINSVKTGMTSIVDFPALPGKEYTAKVTEIAPAVDVNSATYPVRLTIDEPKGEIKSGMAANVSFDFSDQKTDQKALVVPFSSVGEDSKGHFVFLIQEGGSGVIVKKHPIKIGNVNGAEFEVLSGLSAGQKIATAGLQTLLDGQEVLLP